MYDWRVDVAYLNYFSSCYIHLCLRLAKAKRLLTHLLVQVMPRYVVSSYSLLIAVAYRFAVCLFVFFQNLSRARLRHARRHCTPKQAGNKWIDICRWCFAILRDEGAKRQYWQSDTTESTCRYRFQSARDAKTQIVEFIEIWSGGSITTNTATSASLEAQLKAFPLYLFTPSRDW